MRLTKSVINSWELCQKGLKHLDCWWHFIAEKSHNFSQNFAGMHFFLMESTETFSSRSRNRRKGDELLVLTREQTTEINICVLYFEVKHIAFLAMAADFVFGNGLHGITGSEQTSVQQLISTQCDHHTQHVYQSNGSLTGAKLSSDKFQPNPKFLVVINNWYHQVNYK